MNIHPALIGHIEAAREAGLVVHVPNARIRPIAFVYVTQPDTPGVALMQVPSFPSFEPISIDVPVTPNRDHGSAIPQDYDGTPRGAVELLARLVKLDQVMTRFVRFPSMVPVDRRIPADARVY